VTEPTDARDTLRHTFPILHDFFRRDIADRRGARLRSGGRTVR